MLLSIVLVIASIFLLYFGAEFSLDSAEKIGKKLGLSPLIIGMVLIGFGTSLPEFFVSHIAMFEKKEVMAVGSLVGSNIANLFLILGVSALLVNLKTEGVKMLRHLGIHGLLVAILFLVFSRGKLDLVSVLILLSVVVIYMFVLFRDMKSDRQEKEEAEDYNMAKVYGKIILGFGFLFLGGDFLVRGGSSLATQMGVSDYIISAILLAFGTSLPELITSIIASYKKIDTDIIVGNIIGSNLFNCALILGSLGFYNVKLDINVSTELYLLSGGAIALIFLNILKIKLNKVVGALFLGAYSLMVYQWVS